MSALLRGSAMTIHFLTQLAQVDPSKLDTDLPPLTAIVSSTMTWVIVGVFLVGILLITFKTSKRNHLEKD